MGVFRDSRRNSATATVPVQCFQEWVYPVIAQGCQIRHRTFLHSTWAESANELARKGLFDIMKYAGGP